MAFERPQRLSACVPELHQVIAAPGRKHLSVGAEGYCVDA
jgi:hypothetical protein